MSNSKKSNLMHRTHVFKIDGKWRCSYVIPYSGALYADFSVWEDAFEHACDIEEARPWM